MVVAAWAPALGLAALSAGIANRGAVAGTGALHRPHVFFVLQDDYGWNDFHGPALLPFHGNLTALAKEGIMLTNHLVHYHCSPTRRSFISGRLPIHHGEELSPTIADNVDLRWSLISNKLQNAGYKTHWVGKGHVGFLSMAHLPTKRGFDSFTGFLGGGQSYTSSDRWHNEGPLNDTTYSSDLYGRTAVAIVQAHPDPAGATSPLFLYLPWQAVHSPYDTVPGFDCETDYPPYPGVYAGMLNEADIYMGQLRSALHQRKMWDNTLLVYCSDNGGVSENGLAGVNYPLRGEKHTNWAGGYRVAAFVSGGVVPPELRGTTSNLRLHVVDWYPTFCIAAGLTEAQCSDDSPVRPLPTDPNDPTKDIYQNGAWPGLDGVNVWPMLLKGGDDIYEAHHTIVISAEVLLLGEHKLLVGQGHVPDSGPKSRPKAAGRQPPTDGWHEQDGSWTPPPDDWSCGLAYHTQRNISRGLPGWSPENYSPMQQGTHYVPCLFNETADFREKVDTSQSNPSLVAEMWAQLNRTLLTTFKARSPTSMLGQCESQACAKQHWESLGSTSGIGPTCGVPSCSEPPQPSPQRRPHGPFHPLKGATNCSWVVGLASHDGAIGADYAITTAGGQESKDACCAACFANAECVLSTLAPNGCFLHSTMEMTRHRSEVVGCVTGRMPMHSPDGA